MEKESYFVKVPKGKAGEKIKELNQKKELRVELKPKKEGEFILIPIKGNQTSPDGREKFKVRKEHKSVKDTLKERGEKIKKCRYEVIGEIAICEIEGGKEKEIAELIAKTNNVRSVYAKASALEGEYRVRKLKLLYGEDNPITTYKENGVRIALDVKKVFFSPRLSYERARIASLTKNGERVLVMFAGVGPFALVIGKQKKEAKVIGVEINEEACKYFEKNIKLNKLSNVECFCGDVREIVPKLIEKEKFDRIVMPLPKEGEHFIKLAFEALKKGGIIHFYTFVKRSNPLEDAWKKISQNLNLNSKCLKLEFWRKVREYSKDIIQIVLDLKKVC